MYNKKLEQLIIEGQKQKIEEERKKMKNVVLVELNNEEGVLLNHKKHNRKHLEKITKRLNEKIKNNHYYIELTWSDYGMKQAHYTIIRDDGKGTCQILSPKIIELIDTKSFKEKHFNEIYEKEKGVNKTC